MKCQFYIIIGDKEFKVPMDNNVYINATGVLDEGLINEAIMRAYKKKSGDGFVINNEIVFLISNMSFYSRCQDVMAKLGIRGSIQLLNYEKEEASMNSNVSNNDVKDDKKDDTLDVSSKFYYVDEGYNVYNDAGNVVGKVGQNGILIDASNNHLVVNGRLVGIIGDYKSFSQLQINSEQRVRQPINNESQKTVGKTLVKKPQNKSAAFVSLPVIMFVLSFVFLVGSVILLYVLD